MKRVLACFILFGFLIMACQPAIADQTDVVSLGADLSEAHKEQMLDFFGVSEDDVLILTVTNDEEREYLKGLVPEKQIGTRAISSAYVKLAPKNSGIDVKTHNISWVTDEMYANAMITAGIEDAEVVAAAPFKVSGTAALTGIMKAFEKAKGRKLSPQAKKIANEELVLTGELGDKIGKDNAAKLIQDIKQDVVKQKIKSPDDIRELIKKIAAKNDIELTEEQINKILKLMENISKLDLNLAKINQQLEKINLNLDKVKETVEENKGLIQKVLDTINSLFAWLRSIFSA